MIRLSERVLNKLEERRENILNGNINCIPFPFANFREDVPGIEQGRYISITGATKSAKSQFASELLFQALIYAYKHPNQLDILIRYFPLEETPEGIMERFMSYILFLKSGKNIRISPSDLRSTNNDKPLDKSILEILQSDEYQDVIRFFEEKVIFSKAKTPMGIYLECKDYAKANGIIHRKTVKYKNELGETIESDNGFDYYEQNNPKQYRIIFVDHISLIQTQQGMDLRQSMNKLSEFFVELRNDYKYTPIIVHQQAMFESLDAFKMDKLEPSIQNLADSKAIARDLDMCLGIFSPYKYNLHEYKGYNINIFKDNIRFVSVLLNRNGLCNGMLPLYFDGAVNYFAPLCNPKDETGLQKIYNYLDKIRNKPNKVFMFFNKLFNKYGKNFSIG